MPVLSTQAVAASEGAPYVDFVIRLDVVSLNEVRVNYATDNGSAVYNSNSDYVYQAGTLVFAPGELSKTVRIVLSDGTTEENTEFFWLDLNTAVNASVAQRYTPAFIFDNDASPGVPSVSIWDVVVDESAGFADFFVYFSRPSATPLTVNYSTADDIATAGQDYTATSGSLSFAPGEVVKTVRVPILNDSLSELDERFQLLLSSPGGAHPASASATATIGRNDGAPAALPYISATPIAVSEGATTADFVVQLSAPALDVVRVNFATDNISAVYNSSADYTYLADTLVFAVGETTRVVQVPLSDGSLSEATEIFMLDLNTPAGAVVKQRCTQALIFDNDGTSGTPGISVSDVVVDESTQTANFYLSLDRASVNAVSVDYATEGVSAQAGADFVAAVGSLRFAPGEMVKTVSVRLLDDSLPEVDEVFKLNIGNPQNATVSDASGTALIGRNDTAANSTPQLLVKPLVVGEGDTLATFVVQLSAPSGNEVRVNYATDNGTAIYNSSSDYVYTTGTLIFAPGETTLTVPVPMSNGTAAEPDEVFWLDLNTAVNASVPVRYTSALVIDNDGQSGTPAFSVRDTVVDESAQTISFFVTLDRPSSIPVSVSYSTVDATAQAGNDYAATTGLLRFAPGEVAQTVRVQLNNDDLPEADEFFELVLSNPFNATVADGRGSALIGRNDTAPVGQPYIQVAPIAVGEGEVWARFVVQLSAPAQSEVSVNYATDNGTALYNSASDYVYQASTLRFAPGETVKTVDVLMANGTVAEPTEAFWLDLNTAVGAVVSQRYTPAWVFDNDGATGVPAASVSDVWVNEAEQAANFFVSLSGPSVSRVFVPFATASDTAVAGTDFAARSGTLVFEPGEVAKTVRVDIFDDSLSESAERFSLVLGAPTGATIADGVGAARISASDAASVALPQISALPVSASEADTFATVILRLSAPSLNEVRVNYQSTNGTALYNSNPDYIYSAGTVLFAPGQTSAAVRVLLSKDSNAEGIEAFSLSLNGAVNATLGQSSVTITVIDDDNPGAVFSHGASNDIYTISSLLAKVVESESGGIDTVRASISYTLPEHTENLVLLSGALNGLGNTSNNILLGNSANNTLDGKEGVDTAVFSGPAAAYAISGGSGSFSVGSAAAGTDTLISIERLQFSDSMLATDTAVGGNVYRAWAMFNAGFDRAPALGELSLWTSQLDQLGSTTALAQAMINYYAPGISDEVLVTHLWGTIVETPIPLDALSTYVGLVANGTYTQATLLEFVAFFELNTVELAGIPAQVALDPAYFAFPG